MTARYEINLAKNRPRHMHASDQEMKDLPYDAGKLNISIIEACEKVYSTCAMRGDGKDSGIKNVLFKNLNEELNIELQADFLAVRIRGEMFKNFIMVETSKNMAKERLKATTQRILFSYCLNGCVSESTARQKSSELFR